MKRVKEWLYKYIHIIVLSIFIVIIAGLTILNNVDRIPTKKIEYNDKFNLSEVPAGMIIWKHGVPESYTNFVHADSANRYEFFDVGILTQDTQTIYKVRVPFYAIGMFQLGGLVNMQRNEKKSPSQRNLRGRYYVYPTKIIKK